jgi:hypothetical protein
VAEWVVALSVAGADDAARDVPFDVLGGLVNVDHDRLVDEIVELHIHHARRLAGLDVVEAVRRRRVELLTRAVVDVGRLLRGDRRGDLLWIKSTTLV